ncbi:hypothetical protein CAG99_21510 [Streptomyces marincola]|uniref:Carrier domain-containing protein n=1 Tax=Streptomyces marincola TaxID=2878388 RepID=A0A1W7D7I5_9ACTN|nr:hypothetical protein CAG99_21510 [Streptomyces marincola]
MRANGRAPHVLTGLVGGRFRPAARSGAGESDTPATRLAALPDEERRPALLRIVSSEVATVLGHTNTDLVTAERSFMELGFDSMTAVELRNRLSGAIDGQLPATVVFDHPTPAALTEFLMSLTGGSSQRGVLAELDALESALSGVAADDEQTRDAVAARLQVLLSRLNGAGGDAAEEEAKVAETLGSASASEIFDFIDTQLGRSAN